MKLLEQVTLLFQEGKSDKVYEVDLLEVRPGSCVVNFRYGRRGAALKEGSKTVTAVPFAEAKQVFDRLVQAKVDSGYQRSTQSAATLPPTPRAPSPSAAPPPTAGGPRTPATGGNARRNQAILDALARGPGPEARRSWFRGDRSAQRPIERVIWRAGELRLREAEPLLLPLLSNAPALRAYCLAYALGRCGGNDSIEPLGRLFNDRAQPEHVRRMATEALLALSDEGTQAEFRRDLTEKLPPALREQVRAGSAIAIQQELGKLLDGKTAANYAHLHTLYLIGGENVREALKEVFRELPLRAPAFRAFRDVFKSAEFRADGEFFGLLAYRFEKVPAASTRRGKGYSTRTRVYLRKRAWRALRRHGEIGDADYVRLAVGILLPFTDADAVQPATTRGYRAGNVAWDVFAPYWAFNHVLYGNSARFEPTEHKLAFHLRAGRRTAAPVPEREEAFPALWEQTPQALLHLCDESRCAPVHEFAAKALRACPSFLAQLDVEALAMLLGRPYEPTAKLGYDLAIQRMDSQHEPRSLLLALARSAYAPARAQAQTWIDEQRARLMGDMDFLAGLASAPFADTRGFARRILRATMLTGPQEQALANALVNAMLAARAGEEEMAADLTQTILSVIGNLSTLPLTTIRSLLQHPLAAVRELGGELLLKKNYRTEPVPEDLLMSLLDAEQEALRALGLRLLGTLPEPVLVAHEQLLARLATSKLADVRHATRAMLQRLVRADHAAGTRVARLLLDALLRRKLAEGVPAFVGKVLSEDFADALGELDLETLWRLLDSGDTDAQTIGAALLERRGAAAMKLTIPQAVRLANHDLLAVREFAWRHLDAHFGEVRKDLPSAVRLLDTRWDDSRAFGFQLLREKIPGEDFTLEVLVSICDSTRPDVQAFGREMITKHFQDQDGPVMLLKLSEHPSPDVQLFATNYLERYATKNRALWEQLLPFFTRMVFLVNQSRVAKGRVLNFLREEGQRDPQSAGLVLGLLQKLSGTISREDQAAALETMVQIHRAQPSVELPVKLIPFEVRHGV
jgi:predicted DNA-binding WGR domain protein